MCKPISLLMDNAGRFHFIDLEARKRLFADKVVGRRSCNVIPIDKADSHSAIADFRGVNEDDCLKFEYDFSTNKVELDGDNSILSKAVLDAAQAFAEKELRPLVIALVNSAETALLWNVVPHILSADGVRRLAIFSARLVLNIFETQYPNDKRPRQAIEAAERYLESPTEENRRAAAYAAAYAYAAYAARADAYAYAAYAARAAAYAAYAAYASSAAAYAYAAYASSAAAYAYAAYASSAYASSAYAYASSYAAAAREKAKSKIVAEGLRLFAEEHKND